MADREPEPRAPQAIPLWMTGALEVLPAVIVALVLAPFVIEGGTLRPWNPNFADLLVYRLAATDLANGLSVYDTVSPIYLLKFIYPPIAAILMVPLKFGSETAWELILVWFNAWALVAVLRRCRVARGLPVAVLACVATVAFEPIRTTLGYGQINTLLMALIVIDLLPAQGRRRLPRGSLIGLAAAVKLTPLLFAVFLLLIGRKRAAAWAAGVFATLTLLGAAILPADTNRFFADISHGRFNTGSPRMPNNQSWTGVVTRSFGEDPGDLLAGLLVGLAAAAVAVVVAAWLWRQGEPVVAVALAGLGTCLASPLSWTHHWVWGLVLLAGVATAATPELSRRARLGLGAWGLWCGLGLPLVFLPTGVWFDESGPLDYLMADLGPVGGTALVIALFVHVVKAGGLKRPLLDWLKPETGYDSVNFERPPEGPDEPSTGSGGSGAETASGPEATQESLFDKVKQAATGLAPEAGGSRRGGAHAR
jgi:alpha-1,2-mannosyltransferase